MKGSKGSGPVHDAIRKCGYVFRFDAWVIYALHDPQTGAIRYVGYAKNLTERLKGHFFPKDADRTHLAHWIRAIKRRGLYPVCSILEIGSGDHAIAERDWIARIKATGCDLVNRTDGGDGSWGRPHTAETAARMSAALAGKYRILPATRICVGCGAEFILPQKRRARVKHCSRACWLISSVQTSQTPRSKHTPCPNS